MSALWLFFTSASASSFCASILSLKILRRRWDNVQRSGQNGLLKYNAKNDLREEFFRSIVLLGLSLIGGYLGVYGPSGDLLPMPVAFIVSGFPILIALPAGQTVLSEELKDVLIKKSGDTDRHRLEELVRELEANKKSLEADKLRLQNLASSQQEELLRLDKLENKEGASIKFKYADFVLTVDGSPGRYTVEARAPGETQVSPQSFLYYDSAELIEQLEEMQQGLDVSFQTMQAVGSLFYDTLFPRPISRLWERSRLGLPSDTTLRLSLNIRPPELNVLPWELLYDSDDEIFLATRLSYSIVRYIESGTPVSSALTSHPVRLLYLQSNPYDTEPLDLAASLQALQTAWGQDCEITVVKKTTPSALRDVLRTEPGFDILHYDGHAVFDEATSQGYLVLHDANDSSYQLAGRTLADYLDGSSIRLVVLAACETGANSSERRFAGIAHQLMRASRLPAVVAMQFAIADSTAIAFSHEFYKALADDYPVEAALIQGRQAILTEIGGGSEAFAFLDWATPVLFMR